MRVQNSLEKLRSLFDKGPKNSTGFKWMRSYNKNQLPSLKQIKKGLSEFSMEMIENSQYDKEGLRKEVDFYVEFKKMWEAQIDQVKG